MERRVRALPGVSLDQIIEALIEARERGEHICCEFNDHELHSDTITIDSAYLEVKGHTKEEDDRLKEERAREAIEEKKERERKKQEREEREKGYEKKVEESRTGKVEITKEIVIAGLKFIAENPDISQDELVDGLIELGCNFTLEEIREQFTENVPLYSGMRIGDLSCAASVIANMRDSEFGRAHGTDHFLREDDNTSIYNAIRILSEDDTYTKESIKNKKGKSKK